SLALQYGVPLKVLVDKFSHTRFEPSGFTGNPNIPIAKSIIDYIFRWLSLKFLPKEETGAYQALPAGSASTSPDDKDEPIQAAPVVRSTAKETFLNQQDAPPCHSCGEIMVRSGACYKCSNCG